MFSNWTVEKRAVGFSVLCLQQWRAPMFNSVSNYFFSESFRVDSEKIVVIFKQLRTVRVCLWYCENLDMTFFTPVLHAGTQTKFMGWRGWMLESSLCLWLETIPVEEEARKKFIFGGGGVKNMFLVDSNSSRMSRRFSHPTHPIPSVLYRLVHDCFRLKSRKSVS